MPVSPLVSVPSNASQSPERNDLFILPGTMMTPSSLTSIPLRSFMESIITLAEPFRVIITWEWLKENPSLTTRTAPGLSVVTVVTVVWVTESPN